MREALLEAKKAFARGEVPVGAVVVLNGEVIARAHNEVEGRGDATCHAEVLAVRRASEVLGGWRLPDVTVYVTLEPCAMCAGSVILSRVKKVVFGAKDLRHGACGTVFEVLGRDHPIHRVEVGGGVLAEESAKLMKEFFYERRAVSRADRGAKGENVEVG